MGSRFKVGKIIRDYLEGNVEKYQPGGTQYIDLVAPGVREAVNALLDAIRKDVG